MRIYREVRNYRNCNLENVLLSNRIVFSKIWFIFLYISIQLIHLEEG